jgi:UDPglucose 6-dehydrogenase
MYDKNILFVGLGKLGLSLAAILSQKHRVIGYDINSKLVDDLKLKNFSSIENDVREFLKKKKLNLNFIKELNFSKLDKLQSIFILIPTNSSIHGEYSYKNLLFLVKEIIKKIKHNKKLVKKKILINICSTLQPGTYKSYLKPLEKKYNFLNFTYVPEFVACGTTINDFLYPDQIVIGANNKVAQKTILEQYSKVIKTKNINKISIEGCEMVKLCSNSFICNKISFANLISEICFKNKIPDTNLVLKSIGTDSRIGNKFFKAGPPFGGLCFPKDVRAFKNLCQKSNVNYSLMNSVEQINESKKKFIIKKINLIIRKNKLKSIGVIGFTFKEDTKVTDESQYEKIINNLKIKKINVFDENIKYLKINKKFTKETSLTNLLKKNKVIIIFHNKKKYLNLAKKSKKNIFYNVWSKSDDYVKDLNLNIG